MHTLLLLARTLSTKSLWRRNKMSVISFNNDFSKGFAAVKQEISSGDIYCIESAIMQFVSDPPDSEFQRGFRNGLLSEQKKRNK